MAAAAAFLLRTAAAAAGGWLVHVGADLLTWTRDSGGPLDFGIETPAGVLAVGAGTLLVLLTPRPLWLTACLAVVVAVGAAVAPLPGTWPFTGTGLPIASGGPDGFHSAPAATGFALALAPAGLAAGLAGRPRPSWRDLWRSVVPIAVMATVVSAVACDTFLAVLAADPGRAAGLVVPSVSAVAVVLGVLRRGSPAGRLAAGFGAVCLGWTLAVLVALAR